MKCFYGGLIALLAISTSASPSYGEGVFPELRGPLMGQTPPGRTAEPFALGVISKAGWELGGVFAPGMKEFYFTTRKAPGERPTVIGYREEDDVWEQFIEFTRVGQVSFSPSGERMHMADGYRDRRAGGWSERHSLGPIFDRADWGIMRLSASSEGTYVFDDYMNETIRISSVEDGVRSAPKPMSTVVNSGQWTAHPFIAPDESYLIWDSEREGGFGDSDLYISFRQDDGSWGPAMNMGPEVNSEQDDFFASVTPDGNYILFNRTIVEPTNIDIYWVDAHVIERLKIKDASRVQQTLVSEQGVFHEN